LAWAAVLPVLTSTTVDAVGSTAVADSEATLRAASNPRK
jgi:hypothetical protein